MHPGHGLAEAVVPRERLQAPQRVSFPPETSFKRTPLFSQRELKWASVFQLPAGGVGGAEGDAAPLHLGQHEELQLPGPSAGQQQRLRPVPAAVRRELPSGTGSLATITQKKNYHHTKLAQLFQLRSREFFPNFCFYCEISTYK